MIVKNYNHYDDDGNGDDSDDDDESHLDDLVVGKDPPLLLCNTPLHNLGKDISRAIHNLDHHRHVQISFLNISNDIEKISMLKI